MLICLIKIQNKKPIQNFYKSRNDKKTNYPVMFLYTGNMIVWFCFLEVLLSKDSALNLSDSEDDIAIKSTKIELQECHLQSVPVEDDGIPSQNSCGSIHVVFASIMASLGGVLFGYDIGRVGPLFAIRSHDTHLVDSLNSSLTSLIVIMDKNCKKN